MAGPNSRPTDLGAADEGRAGGALPAYRWALLVFLVLGLVQIFLAGYGTFALDGRTLGAAGETAFDGHRMMSTVLSAVALAVVVLAVVGRAGRHDVVLSVLLLVVVAGLQSVLAALGDDRAFVGGLHALVGIAAIGLAGAMHATAIRRAR